jgi:S1-C subfamily serine protease
MTLRFVLLGPDGQATDFHLERLPATIGSGPDADVQVAAVAVRHAVVFERGGEVVLLDSGSPAGTFLAGHEVQEAVLRDGDVMELGRGGPRLRFHGPLRRQPPADTASGRRFSDTLAVRVVQQTSRSFRRALLLVGLLAAVVMGVVLSYTQRESGRLRGQVASLRREVERAESDRRELEDRIDDERVRARAQLDALDGARREEERLREQLADAAAGEVDDLKRELDQAHLRLRSLETERQVGERIISQYGGGVCLLQGSYFFADAEGRPARLVVDEDGQAQRRPDGTVVVDVDSEGPVHRVEFFGTGFMVDAAGLVLTNRHLAEPWWSDEEAEALEKLGFKGQMNSLRAFFPRQEGAFEVKVERVSQTVDLGLLRLALRGRKLPVLPLSRDKAGAVAGQPVVVLGYPAGLEAMLAKAESSVVKQILEQNGTSSDRMTEDLAMRGLIRPSTTQGHIGDITKSDIVFDAATSQGGSGGPVFNKNGEVVAVEYALLSKFGGNSFGVPIAYAAELIAAGRRR